MLKIKIDFFLKRFLITVFVFTIFVLVESVPEHPILFGGLAFVLIVSIRSLWYSALQDKKLIKKSKFILLKRNAPQHTNKANRAS